MEELRFIQVKVKVNLQVPLAVSSAIGKGISQDKVIEF